MRRPENLKKSPTSFDKTAVSLSTSVKTSGRFFQNFVPFSEKLDFKKPKENGTIVHFTSKLFPTLQNHFLINLVDTIFSEKFPHSLTELPC